MTESSWPFDNADTTEAQYSYLLRLIADTGVIGQSTSSDLRAYADSSGLFVKIPAGMAVIRGFFYFNDSVVTLPIAPGGVGGRIDSVVLRLDPTANTIALAVRVGTSSAPTVTITDTGIYELRIADVVVGTNVTTIAAGNVTDRRSFTSKNWGQWTAATRPSVPEGKAGYNFTTKQPEFWDGSQWRSFSTTTTDAGALTTGTLANARLDYGMIAAVRGDRSVDAPMSNDQVNGDWNSILQPGVYRIYAGNTNSNAPAGAYMYGTLVVFGAGGGIASRTQVYYSHQGGAYWRTAWNGNDWGGWVGAANSTDLATANSRITQEINDRASAISQAQNQTQAKLPIIRRVQISSGGNSRDYADVTFPGGYFPSTPGIQVSANSTTPDNVSVSYSNPTPNGCRVYLSRSDGSTGSKISTEITVTASYPTGS
jgi:hypothetical protein